MIEITAPRELAPSIAEAQRMIAVTHVINTLSTGGAEMMLYRLLTNMDRSRFRNSVVALGEGGVVAGKIRAAGIPVTAMNMEPARAITGMLHLARELRRQRPDVIQTWLYHADLLGSLASLAMRDVRVTWNIRCGGLDSRLNKRGTIWISRACAAFSRVLPARIVSCSQSAVEVHASAGYSRAKMQVIPNGFDVQEYRPDPERREAVRQELGVSTGTLLVGAVGRFDPAKDHATLCEAAAIVCRSHPLAHFVMCGENITAANRELLDRVTKAGIANRVHLLGRRDDVPRILAALDVLASSSAVEGFPNAIGEAMACGVPCVVTDAGDSRYLVGDTGLVTPVRNPDALSAGILEVLRLDDERRRALGAMARRRVNQHFGIDRVARQYEELYREMTAKCAA